MTILYAGVFERFRAGHEQTSKKAVCTPVFGLGMRSAEVRARDRRARQATLYRFGSHSSPRAIMVLRMMISLRMQATSATFGGLPLAIRRS